MAMTAPPASDATYQVEFISSLHQIDALRDDWKTLETSSAGHDERFFQSFGWCRHVARVRIDGGNAKYRLHIAVVRQGQRVTGIWPLALMRSGPAWIAINLDDPFGQFAGALFETEAAYEAGIDAVLAALRSDRDVAGIHISKAIDGSIIHRRLENAGALKTLSGRSVATDFRPYADAAAYLQAAKKKSRQNFRSARNRLLREGQIQELSFDDLTNVKRIIDLSFEWKFEWARQLGKTAPAFRDADHSALLDGLPRETTGIDLLGYEINLAGEPLAVAWGFLFEKRYYLFMAARNLAFEHHSVGGYQLGTLLMDCCGRGLEGVEMMSPASPYKLVWPHHLKQIDDMSIAFTPIGYANLVLYRRHLREWAKRGLNASPLWLSRLLTSARNRKD